MLPSGPVRAGAVLGPLNLCGSLVITMRRMVVTRIKAMVKKKEEEEAWYWWSEEEDEEAVALSHQVRSCSTFLPEQFIIPTPATFISQALDY